MSLTDKKSKKQFEYEVEGKIAKVEYILTSKRIFLTHTEVPSELEGQGIGSKMVKLVLSDIKERDLTLVPLCPFIAGYIKRHPEWKELVLKGIKVE